MRNEKVYKFIQENAVRQLSWKRYHGTNLHLLEQSLQPGSRILAHRQEIPIDRDTIMVFADDAPLFNWGHPCRYLLYDAGSGEKYNEVSAQFPINLKKRISGFKTFHEPVRRIPDEILWSVKPKLKCPIIGSKGNRYAILFSGASNNRHTNDLEFLYRTLRDIYNFRDDNIYCLNHDGTINYNGWPQPVGNWPGDNTAYRMPVKGSGTKAELEAVIDDLKTKLNPEDLLLIHTNNHGGWDFAPGTAYLVTHSGPDYYAADFAAKLATLPKFDTLMVMMEQCHSGGFNNPIMANSPAVRTTVASACIESNNSIGSTYFDPFARDWISAMTGNTPFGGTLAFNPDSNGNGKISAIEAFQYADAIHDPFDTPIYNESSVGAGNTHLGHRYYWWWYYCPPLVELLHDPYLQTPIPEFYEKLHRLAPEFEEVAKGMDKATHDLSKKFEQQIKEIVKRGF